MCGIVGIFGHPESSTLAYLALYALQHRGQESAGIVTAQASELTRRAGMGHVADVFSRDLLGQLPGTAAVGHVRYSTAGDPNPANAQPFLLRDHRGPVAIAHNGNLVNAFALRTELEDDGSIFQTTSDTETILHLAARSQAPDAVDALVEALRQVRGAFSLVILVPGRLIAVRDPFGWRPLSLGRLGGAWVVASESCAFDLLGAEHVRDLERGEMVVVDVGGVHSFKPFGPERRAHCFFEFVYFSRPDSLLFGESVQEVRKRLGQELFREYPLETDLVVPVPDSGVYAALGYARASGIPFDMGLVRNHYIGRTFIQPEQRIRELGVRRKHAANAGVLRGKRIVLIDDSVVRGTTSRKIVQLVRDAGAIEVHMRIASPPIMHSDYYGIDTPEPGDLLAARNTLDEMCAGMGADSLAFLSVDGIYRAIGMMDGRNNAAPQLADHCFTGEYPTLLPDLQEYGAVRKCG